MNNLSSTILTVFNLLAILLSINCATSKQNEKLKLPTETEIKKTLLQKIDTSDNFIQLSENSVISFANGEYPIDFTLDKNNVFIAENNKGKIYQINIDNKEVKELSISQESGKNLLFPTSIRLFDEKLWLFDNEGLKIFDKEGKKLNLVRVFSSITHFEINANETIYANSLINKSQNNKPLIIKINKQGEIIGNIGKRKNEEIEEEAFIALTDKHIISAFRNRPVVQIYDKNSEILVKEVNISHPIFAELEESVTELKEDYKKDGKIFLPRYFAGIKTFRDRVFILLCLPHIEIVELDLQGNELHRYQAENAATNLAYFGFDVRSVGEQHQFIVGTMTGLNNPTLRFFSFLNKNKEGGS